MARPGDVAARLSWPKLASGRAEGAEGLGSLCAQSQGEVLAGAGVYMVLFKACPEDKIRSAGPQCSNKEAAYAMREGGDEDGTCCAVV